jgi:hypothetical protein
MSIVSTATAKWTKSKTQSGIHPSKSPHSALDGPTWYCHVEDKQQTKRNGLNLKKIYIKEKKRKTVEKSKPRKYEETPPSRSRTPPLSISDSVCPVQAIAHQKFVAFSAPA